MLFDLFGLLGVVGFVSLVGFVGPCWVCLDLLVLFDLLDCLTCWIVCVPTPEMLFHWEETNSTDKISPFETSMTTKHLQPSANAQFNINS